MINFVKNSIYFIYSIKILVLYLKYIEYSFRKVKYFENFIIFIL